MLISQKTPDEHPPTPPPCRWPALITLPILAKFLLVGRRRCDVVLFRSPACSSTLLRPSVHYPTISLSQILCVFKHCDHLNVLYIFDQTDLYRFEVRLELYGADARLVVCPPPPSFSHIPTPPPSRWPALTNFSPSPSFSSFGAACVKLCCLPPPSLVRNTCLCCLMYA